MRKLVLAFGAPAVIFGVLYMVLVRPASIKADEAHARMLEARDELARSRQRSASTPSPQSVADAISALTNSPEVGRLDRVTIETGAPVEPDAGSRLVPVTVEFDGEYQQIAGFLTNLRRLPSAVDIRSVELVRSDRALMHVKTVLSVFTQGAPSPATRLPASQSAALTEPPVLEREPPARPRRVPRAAGNLMVPAAPPVLVIPDLQVKTILYSESRRLALIDGRIVQPGDRIGPFVVEQIERDGVIVTDVRGARKRIALELPRLRAPRT